MPAANRLRKRSTGDGYCGRDFWGYSLWMRLVFVGPSACVTDRLMDPNRDHLMDPLWDRPMDPFRDRLMDPPQDRLMDPL